MAKIVQYIKNLETVSKRVLLYGAELSVGFLLIGLILYWIRFSFSDLLAATAYAQAALQSGLALALCSVICAVFFDYALKSSKNER